VTESDRRHPAAAARDAADLAGDEIDLSPLQGLSQEREQRVRIEPAFARAAKGARCDAVAGQPVKASLKCLRILDDDVGALGALHDVVGLQDRYPLGTGKYQIALFA